MVEQMVSHVPVGKAAAQHAISQAMLAAVVGERDAEQARLKAQAILEQGERDGLLPTGAGAAQSKGFTAPWFLTFLPLEPGPALQAIRQPILALNGELDQQVPSKLDLDAIRCALANNPGATVMEPPKLNHLFQTATTGASDEYGQIEETLTPAALLVMTDWIRKEVQ